MVAPLVGIVIGAAAKMAAKKLSQKAAKKVTTKAAKKLSQKAAKKVTTKAVIKVVPKKKALTLPKSAVKVVSATDKASRVSRNNAEYLRVARAAGLGDGKTGSQALFEQALRLANYRKSVGQTQNLIKIKGDLPSKSATAAALASKKAAQAALRAAKEKSAKK
jgi:hypothetical protein